MTSAVPFYVDRMPTPRQAEPNIEEWLRALRPSLEYMKLKVQADTGVIIDDAAALAYMAWSYNIVVQRLLHACDSDSINELYRIIGMSALQLMVRWKAHLKGGVFDPPEGGQCFESPEAFEAYINPSAAAPSGPTPPPSTHGFGTYL